MPMPDTEDLTLYQPPKALEVLGFIARDNVPRHCFMKVRASPMPLQSPHGLVAVVLRAGARAQLAGRQVQMGRCCSAAVPCRW